MTGNSIQQALTSRSLTQYRVDSDGNATLVPDLAVDLGQPNDDYTQWTFQLRDNASWEDGSPITAEEVAFGFQVRDGFLQLGDLVRQRRLVVA